MTSVAVLGAGGAGVACAGPLLQLGLASQLTLYDRDRDRARGEALDFRHAAPLLPECTVAGEALDSIRPADIAVLAEYLTRRWESRPVRVFGTGTSLDSWRLRELLALELGAHPGDVHAWVIGEHGDSAVFPFETARVGPFSLAEFGRLSGRPLAAE